MLKEIIFSCRFYRLSGAVFLWRNTKGAQCRYSGKGKQRGFIEAIVVRAKRQLRESPGA
jgi:hypothetical protein